MAKRCRPDAGLPRLIAVEGCIGAGKSTLTSVLSKRFNATQILEDSKRHPFLEAFYSAPAEHAFETELGFILLHYHQLKKVWSGYGSGRLYLSDFAFEKDEIFPPLTLKSKTDRQHFAALYQELKARLPSPEVIIYIRCTTPFLMERIQQRGRPYEAKISVDYLDRLNKAYDQHFLGSIASEVISIDGAALDVEPGRGFSERVFRRWQAALPAGHWLAKRA